MTKLAIKARALTAARKGTFSKNQEIGPWDQDPAEREALTALGLWAPPGWERTVRRMVEAVEEGKRDSLEPAFALPIAHQTIAYLLARETNPEFAALMIDRDKKLLLKHASDYRKVYQEITKRGRASTKKRAAFRRRIRHLKSIAVA
jgi:hypothetical protein